MKWMLVVLIMGTDPLKTDLTFDTVQECVTTGQQSYDEMRVEGARWLKLAEANPKKYSYPNFHESTSALIGMMNNFTCIPHAGN